MVARLNRVTVPLFPSNLPTTLFRSSVNQTMMFVPVTVLTVFTAIPQGHNCDELEPHVIVIISCYGDWLSIGWKRPFKESLSCIFEVSDLVGTILGEVNADRG